MERLERVTKPAGLAIWMLAAAMVGLHLLTAGRYGIFRDELYYLACARHLAFGYVDQPPLIAWVTWFAAHVFGTSLVGLRLLPALAGGLLVWLAAEVARELGGGRFAQILAGFAVIPVPVYLILNHWLTMNAFEPLLWTAMLLAAVKMIRRDEPRYWLVVGALVGVGMENKYTMLLVAVALVFGLLLTPERRLLRSRWFVAGVGLALLLFLPNLIWLWRHGFPFLEFERNSRMAGSRILRGPLAFLWDQALLMNPVVAPLALAGVGWLVAHREARRWRALGWAGLFVVVVLMALKSKNYYVAPIYPLLFAAGAVWVEGVTAASVRWARPAYVAAMTVSGLMLAPLVMPVLSVPEFLAYQRAWHGFVPVRFEALPEDLLPQQFSDEFGWEEMVRRTSVVFHALPTEEQARTAIFANNYGEAAAIDFFGPKYGLPQSVSGNESFWLWGPRGYTGSTVIVLGSDGRGDREHFRTVDVVGPVGDERVRGMEQFDLLLCRGLTTDLRVMWPETKKW
jgi:hypothetical protein